MKATVIGALSGAVLVLVVTGVWPEMTRVQATTPNGANGELISWSTPMADQRQQVTVIDVRQRTMGVYEIDAATGKIGLKSVRNLSWDMQMTEFNCANPSPSEIRSLMSKQ